ncbi:MAG: hypothetical protein HY329_24630 [Chloroflexi bacterium]|nr:hypothetical protein [Chloroflexota bacterium]
MARGLLMTMLEPGPDETDFNRWYDEEHLPERLSVPGFLWAKRFVALKGEPRYMALYDVESPAVLSSEAYRYFLTGPGKTEWTTRTLAAAKAARRGVFEQINPPGDPAPYSDETGAVLAVQTQPSQQMEEEFNAWYDSEHLPYLLAVPGVLRARRFRLLEGDLLPYLALYDLRSTDVTGTPEWKQAVSTPWRNRVVGAMQNSAYTIYRPYQKA